MGSSQQKSLTQPTDNIRGSWSTGYSITRTRIVRLAVILRQREETTHRRYTQSRDHNLLRAVKPQEHGADHRPST
jgi:hypothetical protein